MVMVMDPARSIAKWIVAAVLSLFLVAPGAAQDNADAAPRTLDTMFAELLTAEPRAARRIEREIWNVWSKSGSASADLLLQRGREALSEGKIDAAIEHFTALVDHAPDFAEGWNARATAYFQAGLFGPSVADIAEVLKREPRHFGALAGFAAILEQTGKEAEALEVYKAALAIHPNLAGVGGAVERLERKRSGQNL